MSLLNNLLELDEPTGRRPEDWPNYVELLELKPDHVEELIAIATNEKQFDDYDTWTANIHAWRALGQLQATAAVDPLLPILDWDTDWVWEELPYVYGMLGAHALPALAPILQQMAAGEKEPMFSPAECIQKIAQRSEETRAEAIAIFIAILRNSQQYNRELNGMIATMLMKLKAVETADVLEEAYKNDRVDTQFCGTWASVQVDLGLRDRSEFTKDELRPLYKDMGSFVQWHQEHDRLRDTPETFFTAAQTKREKKVGFGGGTGKQGKKSKKKKR